MEGVELSNEPVEPDILIGLVWQRTNPGRFGDNRLHLSLGSISGVGEKHPHFRGAVVSGVTGFGTFRFCTSFSLHWGKRGRTCFAKRSHSSRCGYPLRMKARKPMSM